MWDMNTERRQQLLEEARDYAILAMSVFIIIVICIVSAMFADYLWTVMGRIGIHSPIAPWFSISAMVLVDIWLVICLLNRFIVNRWPWNP